MYIKKAFQVERRYIFTWKIY